MLSLNRLNVSKLKSKPLYIYNSLLKDKNIILTNHKFVSGIYLLHNSVNGKQYVYNTGKLFNFYSFIPLKTSFTMKNKQFSTDSNNQSESLLKPLYVTGFTGAEESFVISVNKRSDYSLGWKVRPSFQIGLHIKDLPILIVIQKFFNGVGYITVDNKANTAYFYVVKLEDIITYIIPHFKTYPVITKKYIDFFLWEKIINIIINKEHITLKDLTEIISIKAGLNLGLSKQLLKAFPDIEQYPRPDIILRIKPINPDWLVGFITREGSFTCGSIGNSFRARFFITQHYRDLELLEAIKDYFSTVESYVDCFNHIIPFFSKYPLLNSSFKSYNYNIWIKIINIMIKKEHLTLEGRSLVLSLMSQLNKY